DNSVSFLMKVSEVKKLLKSFNYRILSWEDKTEISATAFKKSSEKIKKDGLPPLSLNLLMGKNTVEKIENMAKNLLEKKLVVIQCIGVK
ncbi:MAG: hypothetical protein R3250_14055, partial [Melioribacteraceae bacterium]|nr:hypothetical protein [Melioribacteraceae bacterium]